MTGAGSPVTVFAHGLAGSIAQTRPFGSGVAGQRTFFTFSGHGSSDGDFAGQSADPWDYAVLSAELANVADRSNATRALGISMGAGALLRLVSQRPERFDRLVFVLPSAVDDATVERGGSERSTRFRRLAELAAAIDHDGLTRALLEEQPRAVRCRSDVHEWARGQARLLTRPSLVRALRELPTAAPVPDRGVLATCLAPALVVAAEEDPAHPVWVAQELAAALPRARLEVFGAGGLLWSHRRQVRDLITGFLNTADESEVE